MKVEIGGQAGGPLAGVRALDFTTVVSGPLCTQVLGDLGADVVKVEAPRGDSARRMGPPFRGGFSPVWVQFNRNKRAVVIDLQQSAGVAVARRIAAAADVVVENFRPGVADRLGVGYAALSAGNPRLVYAAISGFGPEGPYAQQPAYDTVIQGLSGFMHTQGTPDAPALVRGIAADKATGLSAASAVIAALFARERSGRGQRIDVAMLDAYAAFALPDVLGPESFHPVEEQPAGMLTATNIHRTWQTADGHVVMMIVEDAQFSAICRALDRSDLEQDARFGGLLARLANGVALYALLEVEVAKWSTVELVERARRFGAPLAPVNGVREFMADPQVRANRTVFEVEDPRAGTLRQLAHPARYADTPASLRRLPPQRGEHTDEVLAEAGYRADEIRALRDCGAVG
ncbi:MAG: CoA transferase [Deltaproteobacteria bacterium]|nr:MAG: CoA transferase [Deltaproteobacteria bacterium]